MVSGSGHESHHTESFDLMENFIVLLNFTVRFLLGSHLCLCTRALLVHPVNIHLPFSSFIMKLVVSFFLSDKINVQRLLSDEGSRFGKGNLVWVSIFRV